MEIPEWFKIAFDGIGTLIISILIYLIYSCGVVIFNYFKQKNKNDEKYNKREEINKIHSMIHKNFAKQNKTINIDGKRITLRGSGKTHYSDGNMTITVDSTGKRIIINGEKKD